MVDPIPRRKEAIGGKVGPEPRERKRRDAVRVEPNERVADEHDPRREQQ